MIDNDTLRIIDAAGGCVVRNGREWRAGDLVLTRSDVNRLYHSGMLTGGREDGIRSLTKGARARLKATPRFPALGSRVTFRDIGYHSHKKRRYLEGHVIATLNVNLIVNVGPVLYRLARSGNDGRWKGSQVMPGAFRDTVAWSQVQDFLPAAWFAPVVSPPHTLARLREVRSRLESIGAYWGITPEEQVAMNYSDSNLPHFRHNAEHARAGAGEYLRKVIANDIAEIEAAESAHVLKDVGLILWPSTWGSDTRELKIPSMQETCAIMSNWDPEMVRDAYERVRPEAQERADRINAIRRRPRTGIL